MWSLSSHHLDGPDSWCVSCPVGSRYRVQHGEHIAIENPEQFQTAVTSRMCRSTKHKLYVNVMKVFRMSANAGSRFTWELQLSRNSDNIIRKDKKQKVSHETLEATLNQ